MIKAAANVDGDRDAQYWLGRRFLEGRTVRQSTTEGVRWLRKAAGQGSYPAQCHLGKWYSEKQVQYNMKATHSRYTGKKDSGEQDGRAAKEREAQAAEEAKTRAAARAAADERRKAAEKAEAEKAVLAAQKAEADAQVAKALQAQERVVSSLESALATAVRRTSVDGGLRPNKFKAASRLRSATMDSGGWDRALATMRADAAKRRTSMENCARSSADLGRRQSLGGFDAIQRRSLMGL